MSSEIDRTKEEAQIFNINSVYTEFNIGLLVDRCTLTGLG